METLGQKAESDLFAEPKFSMATRSEFFNKSLVGEDTIYLSLNVRFNDRFDDLITELDRLKKISQGDIAPEAFSEEEQRAARFGIADADADSNAGISEPPELVSGEHIFYVAPNGMNTAHSRYSNYRYVLHEFGIRYLLRGIRRVDGKTGSGNVYAMVGSLPLMRWGLENCVTIVRDAMESLGGEIDEMNVGRVDMSVDLPDVSPVDFQQSFASGWYVTRSRSFTQFFDADISMSRMQNYDDANQFRVYSYCRKPTAFTFGHTEVMCRIYDKKLEMRHDEEKQQCISEKFGGKMPDKLTRVEFELRRDSLRALSGEKFCGIRSIEDYLAHRRSIWHYLTRVWLRVYSHPVDAKNHNQSKVSDEKLHPLWRQIQAAFDTIDDSGKIEHLKVVRKKGIPDTAALIQQAAGCVGSVLATVVAKSSDFIERVPEVLLLFRDKFFSADFIERVLDKRRFYLSMSPG